MATIAVTYRYIDDPARLDEHRAEHRAYLAELAADGKLLVCGPYAHEPAGALLIFRADDEPAAVELTAQDPFVLRGLVTEVSARTWNTVIGPLAPQF